MRPGRAILVGALVGALGAAIAFAGAGLAGPKNPECGFFSCFGVSTSVEVLGLAVALYGGILIAIGLGRRWSASESEAELPAQDGDEHRQQHEGERREGEPQRETRKPEGDRRA